MLSKLEFHFPSIKEFKTIRVNTIKISSKELTKKLIKSGLNVKKIDWYENGLIIDYESSSKTMEYFLGYYHIQEAASMIPPLVLNPKPGEKILDMCASPGSKTTQVAMMMKNKGTIISNDDNFKRLRPLAFNIQKMGVMNSVVTNYDARSFWRFGLKFDRILLDAPCTNSGIIFKDDVVKKMWSERGIKKLSRIQKELIKSAYISLKENGILVYSTCSFVHPE